MNLHVSDHTIRKSYSNQEDGLSEARGKEQISNEENLSRSRLKVREMNRIMHAAAHTQTQTHSELRWFSFSCLCGHRVIAGQLLGDMKNFYLQIHKIVPLSHLAAS